MNVERCQRCGRMIEWIYPSHDCPALSEAHVNLPSLPAPAASQAPAFEALVDALVQAVEQGDEAIASSPRSEIWAEAEGYVNDARAALLAHHSAVECERDEARTKLALMKGIGAHADDLAAEVERLSGALRAMVEWFWGLQPETLVESFDRVAAEFYRETGVIRPGKSVPLAMNPPWTEEERRDRWDAWVKAKRDALEVRARRALSPSREGDAGGER